jgi:hypothetical protein
MSNLKLTITAASYHRNGVAGVGFYAILFDDRDNGKMVASLFDREGYCAVYNVDELAQANIAFACGNSWRGDHYEDALRPLLKEWLAKEGTNRLGPFSVIG